MQAPIKINIQGVSYRYWFSDIVNLFVNPKGLPSDVYDRVCTFHKCMLINDNLGRYKDIVEAYTMDDTEDFIIVVYKNKQNVVIPMDEFIHNIDKMPLLAIEQLARTTKNKQITDNYKARIRYIRNCYEQML